MCDSQKCNNCKNNRVCSECYYYYLCIMNHNLPNSEYTNYEKFDNVIEACSDLKIDKVENYYFKVICEDTVKCKMSDITNYIDKYWSFYFDYYFTYDSEIDKIIGLIKVKHYGMALDIQKNFIKTKFYKIHDWRDSLRKLFNETNKNSSQITNIRLKDENKSVFEIDFS